MPPPPPPRPPHAGDHLDLEELRRVYNIYHRTPSPNLVDALRLHLQGVRGDRRFVTALLPHGASNIPVRHLKSLPTLPIMIDLTASDGTLFEPYLNGLNHQKSLNGAVESI